MTERTIAGRYARALFDVTVRDKDEEPSTAEHDLKEFVTLLEVHPSLQEALVNPSVPSPHKQAAVTAVLRHNKNVSTAVTRLLDLLAARDRMSLVQEILSAFRARVQDRLQIVRAEVTTAVKLSADRRDAIALRLGEVTGKQVLIDARVDPSIIGGVVAKVSSTVYDGSVATQLERLREQLESGT